MRGNLIMKKIAVVYWSATGNTEAMAKAVAAGAEKAGAEVMLVGVTQFGVGDMVNFDAFIFGCPAMGEEILEDTEFEPFFAQAEKHLKGVTVGLFGSYGWGGGVWMKKWQNRTVQAGANLVMDGLAIENGPSDAGIKNCKLLGCKVAEAI